MDLSRIFLKGACPTSIGGQAVIEGVMMQGPNRRATAMRVPDGRIYLTIEPASTNQWWRRVPILRGAVSFFQSLVSGMQTITKSADVQAQFDPEISGEDGGEEEDWLTRHFGEKTAWNIAIGLSVLVAVVIAVVVFVFLPTAAVGWLGRFLPGAVLRNLVEGLIRIALFLAYLALVSKMEDMRRLFEYHGAEHKTIHCFENGLELTPENARGFACLHPRCGTSFLMFVLLVSLVLFSLLGWPSLWLRVLSRLLLLPVVAGVSYEILKWAGRSDNKIVVALSIPGLLLQKLTTREPNDGELECAICAMKAVLREDGPDKTAGFVGPDGEIEERSHGENECDKDGADESFGRVNES